MANIAIIGTGISGLGAAFLLNPHHNITVYEKSNAVGGHSRTLTVHYDDKNISVDTGFIVFNYRNYPNLAHLFAHLQVPVQKSNMSFGVTAYNNSLEWSAQNINSLFGQRSNLLNLKFYRFLLDIVRFNRAAIHTQGAFDDIRLGDLLRRLNLSEWFAQYYLLPMGGAIWSCPLDTILDFPAKTFIDFFEAHGLLTITNQPQWYTVTGGSKEYVKRLIISFEEKIHVSRAAVSITRTNGKVQIKDSLGELLEYDHVVLACHGNEALKLLSDAENNERIALGKFRSQPNVAVLHKDTSMMPRRKNCWASWVYHAENTIPKDTISVTYWMNQLQDIDHRYPLFVTLNPHRKIPDALVFDTHHFEHPIYDQDSVAAQKLITHIQGQKNTWFCGAYLRNGFHEDGFSSAVEIASKLGAGVPWE